MVEVRVPFNNNILPQIHSMGLFVIERDWIHYDRNIEIDTILFVLEGFVSVCEEGIDYIINAGEAYFLKLNLHHWGKYTIPKGSRWFWVCFTPGSLGSPGSTGEGSDFQWLPKHVKVANPKQFETRFKSMLEMSNSDNKFKILINNSTLYQIFIDLLDQQFSEHSKSHKRVIVDKLTKVLSQDLISSFSAERISENMNMNYSYLCRIFKTETGKTINQYYSELKIQLALDFIQESDLTISQISDELGFPNPYYFSRVFKKTIGVSPRDYQKQIYC